MISRQADTGATRARTAYACAMTQGSWSNGTFLPAIVDHKPVPGGHP
jgi:hypothetical protein